MKLATWGASLALLAVVGLALQGCGYKLVKEEDWLAKDEKIAALEDHNRTASANLAAQITQNKQLNEDKSRLEKEVLESKSNVLNAQRMLTALDAALKGIQDRQVRIDELTARLRQSLGGQDVTVETTPAGTMVRMQGDVLFDSGRVAIKDDAKKVLDQIAEAIKGETCDIRVSGFTDSDPILRSEWKTNTRLSAERAMAVIDYLTEKGVAAERMHCAGYGEYKLMRDPGGAENKKASRRVEMLLIKPEALLKKIPDVKELPPKKGPPEK